MTDLTTDLSAAPFFDDFNEEKKFVRVLFRPSKPVQSRELNQIQSILQNQISRFASHIFKEGSVVDGISLAFHPRQKYVHLKNTFIANTARSLESLSADNIIVSSSGVRAAVKVVARGFELQYPATNIAYVDYLTTGKDVGGNDVNEFLNNEVLTVYNVNQSPIGTLDANNIVDTISTLSANSVGTGYAMSISGGLVYQKGHFSLVSPQTTIINKYATDVTDMVAGFQTEEIIVTEDGDSSLFDNSNSITNRNAPGAYRLKLEPKLIAINKSAINSYSSFLSIVEFSETEAVIERESTVYEKLGEEFAKRTAEQSGQFVVKPFSVESIDHPTDTALMQYAVSPGIGYVNGSRVELVGTKRIPIQRAITTTESQSQQITANYGNYVYVREVAGLFDIDKFGTINLYDAAQMTYSDIENASATPTGTLIGTAIIRGIEYDSGVKGTISCVYRAYIGNIKMNSGKSFSVDVKSIQQTSTFGSAKADLILAGGVATIIDSNSEALIFPFGSKNVKRLTDALGVNDTQYVFRDVATATMAANGTATYTINSPYAGGSERLLHSVGPVSDTVENQYNVVLSAAGYSANIASVTYTSTGNNVVTGTGLTSLVPGQFVRNPTTAFVSRVVSVANAAYATFSTAVPAATANNLQRYFPEGSTVSLSGANGSVTILSNTQFTVSTGISLAGSGSQPAYVQYPVLRTGATAIKKNISKSRFVKIDCSANLTGPWDLGLVDIQKITGIYIGASSYAETNPNHPEWFSFDNGQTLTEYNHGQISILPQYASQITSTTRLLVKLDVFESSFAAGIGFYSVDSYPFIFEGQTANTTNISMADVSKVNGYDVRELIDFRPQRFNTANTATSVAAATINPAVANSSYNTASSGVYNIQPDANFQADLEYYLTRKDLLTLSTTGELGVIKGVPSEYARTPINLSDSMTVAVINVPAYPSLTTRQGELYGRSDLATAISIVTNRRYTNQDVGTLDQRLKAVEYYVALNALEQSAKDMTIADENGLDRFKNGIFANPFNSHKLGKVSDFEYKISIDKDLGIARPYFKTHAIDYAYSTALSSNTMINGTQISLPYSTELFISQPRASKYRNCTESVWNWGGTVDLFPSYDHFQDQTLAPAVNVTVDNTQVWEDFANSPFGTIYGDWRTIAASTVNSVASSVSTSGTATTTSTTTTSTTTTTNGRDITSLGVSSISEEFNLGTFITDISLNPYMRSVTVAFVARGLKPNTKIYPFFDDVNVSAKCAPGVLSGISNVEQGDLSRVVTQSGSFGSQLVSNSAGICYGLFTIPAGQFRVGDRVFRLANVDNLITGNDAILTEAKATFTASNMSVTSQNTTLTTIQPTILASASTERNVVVDTKSSTLSSTVVTPIVIATPTSVLGESSMFRGGTNDNNKGDPIAESFLTVVPQNVSGMFIDSIGVYFKSKDSALGVSVIVTEMDQGDPDTSRVIATKRLSSSEVNVSNDSSVETLFDFPGLPYLTGNKYYAFMVKPDGDSPEYAIWCAEIGMNDVLTNEQIFSNPYVGVMYVSANMNAWSPVQTEDIKFNVYRAKFTSATGTIGFTNENDEYITTSGLTKANTTIGVQVGDIVYTQNSTGGVLTSNAYPTATIQAIDESQNTLVFDASTGGFAANTVVQIHRKYLNGANTISSSTLVANTTIKSLDNISYSAIVPRFSYITPNQTSIVVGHKGMDTAYNVDSTNTNVNPEDDNQMLDRSRIIASRSNEVTNAGKKSSTFTISIASESDYVSPIVDMIRKNSLVIENIINNDLTNEHTRLGNALSKYISPDITLADGMDAEDIEVYVTAHRPVGTDVSVFVKFLNQEDSENIDSKVWTLLTNQGAGVYTSSLNARESVEYRFTLPKAVGVATSAFKDPTTGIVEYSRADGARYVRYKQFCIKIVLTSTSKHIVPTIDDVRAAALQV